MCALDPLGYAASQFFIVPFLVLLKAVGEYAEKQTEKSLESMELISKTCELMIASNDALKE